MLWIAVALGAVYSVGFVGIFLIEANVGPVTPGLALYRAAVWPWYLATGKPEGQRAPMD